MTLLSGYLRLACRVIRQIGAATNSSRHFLRGRGGRPQLSAVRSRKFIRASRIPVAGLATGKAVCLVRRFAAQIGLILGQGQGGRSPLWMWEIGNDLLWILGAAIVLAIALLWSRAPARSGRRFSRMLDARKCAPIPAPASAVTRGQHRRAACAGARYVRRKAVLWASRAFLHSGPPMTPRVHKPVPRMSGVAMQYDRFDPRRSGCFYMDRPDDGLPVRCCTTMTMCQPREGPLAGSTCGDRGRREFSRIETVTLLNELCCSPPRGSPTRATGRRVMT